MSDKTAYKNGGIKETESRTAPISCITQEKSVMKPTETAAENAAEIILFPQLNLAEIKQHNSYRVR